MVASPSFAMTAWGRRCKRASPTKVPTARAIRNCDEASIKDALSSLFEISDLYKMLVEDLLHERYDEHPENTAEGNYKDCASGRKPYLVVIDIGGCIEVEVMLFRLSIFVMAAVVMVVAVIMVAFFFIVAMVRMSIGFGCKHLLEKWDD